MSFLADRGDRPEPIGTKVSSDVLLAPRKSGFASARWRRNRGLSNDRPPPVAPWH
jgi:hypothetical protein